jgi:uncharacterized membrane protein YfcA
VILALTLALAIGFSLTVLGSGGSIITLPVLVYAARVPPQQAVGMSLGVGGTSLAATLLNARSGHVHLKAGTFFSLTGIVGAFAGAQLTHLVSPALLMLLFAGLMIAIAIMMLRSSRLDLPPAAEEKCSWLRCSLSGLVVGGLTGFLGVGGGFLIVPALIFFGHLPLKSAVITSLLVIAVNSFAGLAGHLRQTPFDWKMAALFLGASLVGMLSGRLFARRLAVGHLRVAFAWFVLAVGTFVIAKNWSYFLGT